ncbi:MAG: hypothetical protein AABO57_10475 [Acidobacteriota bacterium]
MKVWKNKLVTILFALAGVLFLVPTVKSVIKGEPLNVASLVLSLVFLVFSLVLGVAGGRKSGEGSGPPSA